MTFEYFDKSAHRVQIRGEWAFLASDGKTAVAAAGWVPGAFVSGNAVADMKEVGQSGLWRYTIPLPSGVFNYGFFVDCASDIGSGCTQLPDPANAAWNVGSDGAIAGSRQSLSQVYVPADADFGTVDNSWQAPPSKNLPRGSISSVSYSSPQHVTPAGSNLLAVYTPPNYDPNRATPYSALYLSHGGGGSETDWSTQGNALSILDNLINSGQIEPVVAVMVNFQGYGATCPASNWENLVATDIVSNVIPFIESSYNVADEASKQAFAGLSCGGALGHALLIDHTDTFTYYGLFSPGGGRLLTGVSDAELASYDCLGIFVGGGYQEPLTFRDMPGPRVNAVTDVAVLSDAGIAVTPEFMNGVHSWTVWRVLLKDYLLRVALKPAVDRLAG